MTTFQTSLDSSFLLAGLCLCGQCKTRERPFHAATCP